MLECVGFSEIGNVACGILKYRYPDIRNFGDATAIIPDELPDFDFLCGGFPCQSFSIAGKRQGFDDTRGTLFFEIARILSHKRPRHFLLENVRGLVSHDGGKTLQRILGILSDLNYRVESTVLNSKNFGVPQNRERVFFIGHLGTECSGEILSFGQDDGTLNELSGQSANYVTARYFGAQATGTYLAERELNAQEMITAGTLRTYRDGEGFRPMVDELSPSLNARARQDGSQQPIIQINPSTESGGKQPYQQNRVYDESGIVPAHQANLSGGSYAVNVYSDRVIETDEVSTLKARADSGRSAKHHQPCVVERQPLRYLNRNQKSIEGESVVALDASQTSGVKVNTRIRRLTPVECARLQGFLDDWADFGTFQNKRSEWHVREISDTGKYQVFGNAVTVNVVEAIISRMIEKGCLG